MPVLAATARLVLIVGVGLVLLVREAPLWTLFALVAAGMVLYGAGVAVAVVTGRWGERAKAASTAA